MKQPWLNNALPIAAILSFRMLGLFMLIPVFTVYATQLVGATPTLLGIALGGYGLSQGILQIPFGMLSDRYGRKPILTLGLILFTVGSVYGAYTHSIYGMIFARILQGAGAIGSVLIALLADLTPDKHRTKAMAVIGVTIGISFSLAIVLSPIITRHFGLSGIFYITAGLAILGLLMIHTMIPTPIHQTCDANATVNAIRFKTVIGNHNLQRLDLGIFFLHLILTSTFYAIPMLLQQQIKQGDLSDSWHFYLPLMIVSFLAMVPCIVFAEKKRQMKRVFIASVAVIGLSQWVLAFSYHSLFSLWTFMFTYFVAFNILEACLPSLISKQAPIHNRGCAMGIYSSSQFLGIFAGGALSGILFQNLGYTGIFIMNGSIALLWFFLARYMPNDRDP
ncbi:MAG: MFS transporter [Legionellaceae bacterium]|nr:MFS transporter [Legionellaceae bacterium]